MALPERHIMPTISPAHPLLIEPAQNGGWAVYACDLHRHPTVCLAAFTQTADLIEAMTPILSQLFGAPWPDLATQQERCKSNG